MIDWLEAAANRARRAESLVAEATGIVADGIATGFSGAYISALEEINRIAFTKAIEIYDILQFARKPGACEPSFVVAIETLHTHAQKSAKVTASMIAVAEKWKASRT